MLKHKYKAAITILGVSLMTSAMPVMAAEPAVQARKLGRNSVCISDGRLPAEIKLQGCDLSELLGGWKPEAKPEQNKPCVKPEQNRPENNKPENNKPELPEQNRPENNKPELPEQNKPGNNNPNAGDSAFAMRVIELVNQERAKEGLPALQYDASVEKAALVRAKETEVSFSHTRPNGSSFSTALKENGVSYQRAGENIAYGQKTPEEVMKGWMNSPGHRGNIMNKNFKKIGVGYYQNSKGVKYWTQLFTA